MVADFTQYNEAVAYVEKLVANGFPAGFIAIVGTDVRTVERVRGRLSYARVALNGAITGSWLGLIFAFFFGGTATESLGVSSPLTAGIVMGAGLGMLFAVIRMSLAKSKRHFVSQSSVIALKYQVQVPASLVGQALAAGNKADSAK